MTATLRILACGSAVFLSACASRSLPPETAAHRFAAELFKGAGKSSASVETRAAGYLAAAWEASRLLDSAAVADDSRQIYNRSATDLAVLLHKADGGRLWNRPIDLTANGRTYRLRFAPGTRDGAWDPAYFTALEAAADYQDKDFKTHNTVEGIGGTLVGIHKPTPLPAHHPRVGITSPVTATIDFNGNTATLTLLNPTKRDRVRIAGANRTLAADFSAPLSYYPHESELWHGLMGALRVDSYMKTTGLYIMQAYDPDRIPVIFVHGLISTPRMWRSVINELEADPSFRKRYQCWLFGYPTGNPPAYSALRFRQELASVAKIHPDAKPIILVGHSMGGLVSRMQITTLTRESWNVVGSAKAKRLFSRVKPGDIVDQASCFEANPRIGRAIFICTPHRGSDMALGRIGEIGSRLISLPANLTNLATRSLGDSIGVITGDPHRMPNSVSGLSPTNPTLKVLDHSPIRVPHHSIIGDRGKGDTPDSSDGVVAYWSSHLDSAKSECIVPGPHGACEMPETIAEIRRILRTYQEKR